MRAEVTVSGEPVTPAARLCLLCGDPSNAVLGVVPMCRAHDTNDVEIRLQERWDMVLALSRWLTCRDVYGSIRADDPAGVEEAAAGLQAATDNLERVARKVVG